MPARYRQKSSPGRARGLFSLSPAFLLLCLQNTLEAPRSCHFSAQAPQTDTYSCRYEDSSSDLLGISDAKWYGVAWAVSVDMCGRGGGGRGEYVFLMMTLIEDVFSHHPFPTCIAPYCTRKTPRPNLRLAFISFRHIVSPHRKTATAR